jgi:hypothetical protein
MGRDEWMLFTSLLALLSSFVRRPRFVIMIREAIWPHNTFHHKQNSAVVLYSNIFAAW